MTSCFLYMMRHSSYVKLQHSPAQRDVAAMSRTPNSTPQRGVAATSRTPHSPPQRGVAAMSRTPSSPTVWCGCHVKDCTLSHTAWYGCHVKDHCAAKPSRAWWRRGRNLDQEELWEIFIVLEESPPRPISFFLKNYFPLSFFSCKSRSEQRPISFLI